MKRILLLLIIASPLTAMDLRIDQQHIFASAKLGALEVLRTQDGFSILKDGLANEVKPYDIDPVLRGMSKKQLAQALVGTRIKITQLSNEDYKLSLIGGLKGGGGLGATACFWLGKTGVYVAAHGTIWIIAAASGPAAPVVYTALTAAWAAPIEAASNVVAISAAIAGGVATGPV